MKYSSPVFAIFRQFSRNRRWCRYTYMYWNVVAVHHCLSIADFFITGEKWRKPAESAETLSLKTSKQYLNSTCHKMSMTIPHLALGFIDPHGLTTAEEQNQLSRQKKIENCKQLPTWFRGTKWKHGFVALALVTPQLLVSGKIFQKMPNNIQLTNVWLTS